jgi:hypothetical protein
VLQGGLRIVELQDVSPVHTKEKPMAEDTETAATAEPTTKAARVTVGPYEDYAGKTLGIVALVLSFSMQLPALILGIIAWVWSKKLGISNVPAKVAVAVSSALIVLGILIFVGWIIFAAAAVGGFGGFEAFDAWDMRGPGRS